MKKSTKFIALVLALCCVFGAVLALVSCGNGKSAYDIAVKNGFVGTEAEWLESLKGQNGTNGTDGTTPVITIGENGDWYINGVDTAVKATGATGETGSTGATGNGVASIAKTSTEGLVDTYTITYTDGTTTTFTVTNGAQGSQGEQGIQGIQGVPGKDGKTPVITIGTNGNWFIDGVDTNQPSNVKGDTGNGIASIAKTGTEGLVDTYTITFTDGTTTTFTVTNGAQGSQGEQGIQGIQGVPGKDGKTPVITIGENGNWFIDGVDTNVLAEAEKGAQGEQGEKGEQGVSVLSITYMPDELAYKFWLSDATYRIVYTTAPGALVGDYTGAINSIFNYNAVTETNVIVTVYDKDGKAVNFGENYAYLKVLDYGTKDYSDNYAYTKLLDSLYGEGTVDHFFDIDFYMMNEDGEKIDLPEGTTYTVQIVIGDELDADADLFDVYHIVSGEAVAMDAKANTTDNTLTFQTESFSPYAVYKKHTVESFVKKAVAYKYEDYTNTITPSVATDYSEITYGCTLADVIKQNGQNTTNATADIARMLGALYRANNGELNKITYNGVVYTWDTKGTLAGSNWVDASGNTLVKTIATDIAKEFTTNHDYKYTIALKLNNLNDEFKIILNVTLDTFVKNALDYTYADYTYTNGVTYEEAAKGIYDLSTLNYSCTLEDIIKTNDQSTTNATADIARLLGALYRANNKELTKITYNGVEYTWDENGTLAGSNWVDDKDNTLVSAIVKAIATKITTDHSYTSSFELTLNDLAETLTLNAEVTAQQFVKNALDYVYPDFTYTNAITYAEAAKGIYDLSELSYACDTEYVSKAKDQAADISYFLGALYRANSGKLTKITFEGIEYTWNAQGTSKGSNWVDAQGNTLVAKFNEVMTKFAEDDEYAETVTFKLNDLEETIDLNFEVTLQYYINNALKYKYSDYSYTHSLTYNYLAANIKDLSKLIYTCSLEDIIKVQGQNTTIATADLARFLGALYRSNNEAVTKLTYNGVEYTWDENGTLLGSNWIDDHDDTLVSVIVKDIATKFTTDHVYNYDIVLKLNDRNETFTYTIDVTTQRFVKNALEYTYSDYSYTNGLIYDEAAKGIYDLSNLVYTCDTADLVKAEGQSTTNATADVARFLGALYRANNKELTSITYNGVKYTWNEQGTLAGSNWVDSSNKTLVSAIVTDIATKMTTDKVYTDSITLQFNDLAEEVIIKMDDLVQNYLKNAVDYVYTDYSYTNEIVLAANEAKVSSHVLTTQYKITKDNTNVVVADLARFLGALYRANNGNVVNISYNGVKYTWDAEGTLLGSNWVDSNGNTLVKAVVAAFASNSGATFEIDLTLNEDKGVSSKTVRECTAKIVMEIETYVAYNGDETAANRYATLADAVAKAKDGDTITLVDDITLTEAVVIDKAITIDLNGHSIYSEKTALLKVTSGVTLTGEGTLSTDATDVAAIDCASSLYIDEDVTVEGTKAITVENYSVLSNIGTIEGAVEAGQSAMLMMTAGTITGDVTLNGAMFSMNGGTVTGMVTVDQGTLMLMPNSVIKATKAEEGEDDNIAIKLVESKDATTSSKLQVWDGKIAIYGVITTVTNKDTEYKAVINYRYGALLYTEDEDYDNILIKENTIEDALADANDDDDYTDKIVLCQDFDINEIEITKNITIDFNGHTITSSEDCFYITDGVVTLTGKGVLTSTAKEDVLVYVDSNYDELTDPQLIIDEDITLNAIEETAGLALFGDGNLKDDLTYAARAIVKGTINTVSCAAVVTLGDYDNVVFTLTEKGTLNTTDTVAILVQATGVYTIEGTVNGGIEVLAGVVTITKTGKVYANGKAFSHKASSDVWEASTNGYGLVAINDARYAGEGLGKAATVEVQGTVYAASVVLTNSQCEEGYEAVLHVTGNVSPDTPK